MRKALAWATLAAAAVACLGGCPTPGVLLYTLIGDAPSHTVKAQYHNLSGHRLAVVVHLMESTDAEFPDLAADLESRIKKELKDRLSRLTFVSQETIDEYKRQNLRWGDTPPAEIGKKLDAEMVLHLNVDYYSPTQPRQMNFLQGQISCKCQLVDVKTEQRAWDSPEITVLYPPKEYGSGMSTNAKTTEKQLLKNFSERLVWAFYDHLEPDE